MERILSNTDNCYSVTDEGEVYSLERISASGKRLKRKKMCQSRTRDGYCQISLRVKGKLNTYYVHRLVAQEFLNLSEGLEINHRNLDKSDNRVDNLEVVTKSQNITHGHDNGVMGKPRKPVIAVKDNDGLFFRSRSEAKLLGFNVSNVSKAVLSNSKYRGYTWYEYNEDN